MKVSITVISTQYFSQPNGLLKLSLSLFIYLPSSLTHKLIVDEMCANHKRRLINTEVNIYGHNQMVQPIASTCLKADNANVSGEYFGRGGIWCTKQHTFTLPSLTTSCHRTCTIALQARPLSQSNECLYDMQRNLARS